MDIPKLSSPTKLLAYLESIGAAPKKRLSQNFLIDGNILNKIVSFGEISPVEKILEIGPGPGALTDVILSSGSHVIAVEKDVVLAKALQKWEKNLTVLCQDILDLDLDDFSRSYSKEEKMKVIGNLPYHLTTPILVKFLPRFDLFSSVTVMVQKEFAERLTAIPGNKDYSSLTVFANLYSTPRFGFKVSRRSFYPVPGVDSAVIRFDLQPPPKEIENPAFFTLTRTAFSKRRKMLTTSLSSLYSKEAIAQALIQIGLPEKARPEILSSQQFIQLFNLLSPS